MERRVHAIGPLSGTVTIPGDRRLMLMTLALGMITGGPVIIENAPPGAWTESFEGFLARHGASIDRSDSGIVTIVGHDWSDEVCITSEVPSDVLHVVAATAVFSGSRVIFEGGAGDRAPETECVFGLLSVWGIDREQALIDGDDVTIESASFTDPGAVEITTAQALETALAMTLAAKQTITVSYAPQMTSHVIRLAECLGCRISTPESGGSLDRDHELTRRLARMKGGKAMTTVSIDWDTQPADPIVLPGDSVLAAAICGTAVMVPRSKVTVRQVIWEADRRGFFDTIRRMKGSVTSESAKSSSQFDTSDITVQWAPLEGVHVTAEQSLSMLSEFPVLSVVAATAAGKTVLSTDPDAIFPGRRVCSLVAAGLEILGAHAGDFEVGIVLNGVPELRGSLLDAGENPDAALALSVAALTAAGDTVVKGVDDDMPRLAAFFNAIESVAHSSLPLS